MHNDIYFIYDISGFCFYCLFIIILFKVAAIYSSETSIKPTSSYCTNKVYLSVKKPVSLCYQRSLIPTYSSLNESLNRSWYFAMSNSPIAQIWGNMNILLFLCPENEVAIRRVYWRDFKEHNHFTYVFGSSI